MSALSHDPIEKLIEAAGRIGIPDNIAKATPAIETAICNKIYELEKRVAALEMAPLQGGAIPNQATPVQYGHGTKGPAITPTDQIL